MNKKIGNETENSEPGARFFHYPLNKSFYFFVMTTEKRKLANCTTETQEKGVRSCCFSFP